MKILIDQNISFRILSALKTVFENIAHVRDFDLIYASDIEIFKFAKENNFDAVLTMDEDFQNILYEYKTPPKIIWVRTGNCPTKVLEKIIIGNADAIKSFLFEPEYDSIEIFK